MKKNPYCKENVSSGDTLFYVSKCALFLSNAIQHCLDFKEQKKQKKEVERKRIQISTTVKQLLLTA